MHVRTGFFRRSLARALLSVAAAGVLLYGGLTALTAGTAGAVAPRAIILATTVATYTGPGSNIEETYLKSQGYTVTLVTATAWASMTTSQFATYRLIVFGDPDCGGVQLLTAAVANESTWMPAVNGNVIIIGTDPVFHHLAGLTGPLVLIQKGLDFAGGQTGKTGLYLDLSCYYTGTAPGTSAPILNGIESGFQLSGTPCVATVDVVATNSLISGLTNTDLSHWTCSVHEYMTTWPSDFVPIAIDTTATTPTYTAPDGTSGDPYIMGRGSGLVAGNISLSPAAGSQTVGSTYTLTALVQSGGSPVTGATVTFTCSSGPNAGDTSTATTNSSGDATFTYSSSTAGTDVWHASFVDTNNNTETSNTASVTWTPVALIATTLSPNAATGDYHDSTSVSAKLTKTATGAGIAGQSVSFTLNASETCSGTTNATGVASCSIAPSGEAAGAYTLVASFAGGSGYATSTGTATFTVTHEQTGLAYTGTTSVVNGHSITMSAKLTTDDPAAGTALGTKLVTFSLGTGAGAQSCSGTTNATGVATCTVTPVNQAVGTAPVKASFAEDTWFLPATATSTVSVFAPEAVGAFVIGNLSAAKVSATQYFWGSQWAKMNKLRGGMAPNSMKGFADSPSSMTCGGTWTSRTGNSSAPPATITGTIEVIVSSTVTQKGSVLSGTITHIFLVQVSGYGPAPGHVGTGTIVGTVC